MKLTEKHFTDWESHVFGYGYGSGERYTLRALKLFLYLTPLDGNYDHRVIQNVMGDEQCWLLINTLCHADVLDYGTSPRFGWLSEKGKLLKEFVDSKTLDDLYVLTDTDQDYIHCYPDHCNCDTKCNNPMFGSRNK